MSCLFYPNTAFSLLLESLSSTEVIEFLGIPMMAMLELGRKRAKVRKENSLLSPQNEVYFILLHLRQYIVDLLLGVLFGISVISTTYRIRIRLMDWFYTEMAPKISMQSPEHRLGRGKDLLGKCITFLLDGSEQPCLSSLNAQIEPLLYSSKKGEHSITTLAVTDTAGTFLFIGLSQPGGINDDALLKESHQWTEELLPEEYGIGDNGFDGELAYSLRIMTPPKKNHPAFNLYSRIRYMVECAFCNIKIWRCCSDTLRKRPDQGISELLETHHKYWVICAALTNEWRHGTG